MLPKWSTRPLVPTIYPKVTSLSPTVVDWTESHSTLRRTGKGATSCHRTASLFFDQFVGFFNCPMYSAFYNLKMKYDESDNIAVRASRAVTDRIGDTFG